MGLFASRPEEPTEWAGLPGEPLRVRTAADLLPDTGETDAVPSALLGLSGTSVVSVEVPLTTEPAPDSE